MHSPVQRSYKAEGQDERAGSNRGKLIGRHDVFRCSGVWEGCRLETIVENSPNLLL